MWFYFPEHGRYVLSLLPRADLGFKKAGEIRGGLLAFTLDGDSVRLECMRPIASGGAAFHLYVLHDDDWEPASDRQKDWPADGSITAEEIAAAEVKPWRCSHGRLPQEPVQKVPWPERVNPPAVQRRFVHVIRKNLAHSTRRAAAAADQPVICWNATLRSSSPRSEHGDFQPSIAPIVDDL